MAIGKWQLDMHQCVSGVSFLGICMHDCAIRRCMDAEISHIQNRNAYSLCLPIYTCVVTHTWLIVAHTIVEYINRP